MKNLSDIYKVSFSDFNFVARYVLHHQCISVLTHTVKLAYYTITTYYNKEERITAIKNIYGHVVAKLKTSTEIKD